MKRDQGIKLERAREMAETLVEILKPACLPGYCQIAGSIRRLKSEPNDIEIVVAPLFREGPHEFWGTSERSHMFNRLDRLCSALLRQGTLEKRPDKNARFCWGERIKRAIYYYQGESQGDTYAPLDLFSCIEPAQWGVIYAIRTGPGDFNRLLVTSQRYGGACPLDRKVAGGRVWYMSSQTPEEQATLASMPATKFVKLAEREPAMLTIGTPQEKSFFDALHVPWWPPEERTLARLRQYLRQK